MQMTKQGSVKDVPAELAEFMTARGWKPAATGPLAPETPAEEPTDAFVVWSDPEDEDVVDPDDVNDSDTDSAEEQS